MEATMSTIKQFLTQGRQIIWDSDGTLNDFFDQPYHLERMCDVGFFRNLNPYAGGVGMLRSLLDTHGPDRLFICSSVHLKDLSKDKVGWFKKYVPKMPENHILIVDYCVPKSAFLGKIFQDGAVLIDDYTKNLIDWEAKGGIGIKAINTINHKKGVWKGLTLNVV